jgi:hypothetical protein
VQIPSEVWPVVAAVASGVLAWLATRTKTKGDQQIADRPDWQGFTDQIQEWTEQRLAERDKKIDRLEQDVGELRAEVSVLRRKYNAALLFIRDLVRKSPEVHADLPGEIVDDL